MWGAIVSMIETITGVDDALLGWSTTPGIGISPAKADAVSARANTTVKTNFLIAYLLS
jgi:hypothetical protein